MTTPAPVTGSVILVGAGPGDPDLITVGGRRAIENADVLVTDRLIPTESLDWVKPSARIIDVAKVPYGRSTPQEEINRILIEEATAGNQVVRLKGGDNFVFGRGGEELLACAEAGVPTRVIPGVSSAIAVPAIAGVPLTHRGLTQGFVAVSGHLPPEHPGSQVAWNRLATCGLTIVVMMGVKNLAAIADALIEHGLDPATPSVTIAEGTLKSEVVVRARVEDLAQASRDAGVEPPAITVIGDVAGLDVLG